MILPTYETSGQELGETRAAMAKGLMTYLEGIINKYSHWDEKYHVLIHAKPFPGQRNMIKQKFVIVPPKYGKPPMMLSCLLFGVDNKSGKLTLEWALPGDWPTWSVGGTNEPVPEVIASIDKSGIKYRYDSLLAV
jgi:hypothetical protein